MLQVNYICLIFEIILVSFFPFGSLEPTGKKGYNVRDVQNICLRMRVGGTHQERTCTLFFYSVDSSTFPQPTPKANASSLPLLTQPSTVLLTAWCWPWTGLFASLSSCPLSRLGGWVPQCPSPRRLKCK